MASKGPRSKLDYEPKAKRQKAHESPKEPQRPKTHWDHLLEEMVWLSKDFESERKFKLGLAKRVAIKASKGMMDHATRGERKQKEEELRMRKVALNISKDVKKFWTKIEKLVQYKNRLELDQKKKKALDKQLEYLLGQTERYSTMLAENLGDSSPRHHAPSSSVQQLPAIEYKDQIDANGCAEQNGESQSNILDTDEDYMSENEPEDDEHTIEEDEALITEEERKEELAALQNEVDLPLEELLKRYTAGEASTESTDGKTDDLAEPKQATKDDPRSKLIAEPKQASKDDSRSESIAEPKQASKDDSRHELLAEPKQASKDDPRSELIAEPKQASKDDSRCNGNDVSDNGLKKAGFHPDITRHCIEINGGLSILPTRRLEIKEHYVRKRKRVKEEKPKYMELDFNDEKEDADFVVANGDDKDDETTLMEEEELAKAESDDAVDELALLQKESEIPIEDLLARYRQDLETNRTSQDDSDSESENLPKADSPIAIQPEKESNQEEMVYADGGDNEERIDEAVEAEVGDNDDRIADAAAAARSAQPTGNTFLTTKVRTKYPFLLKFSLREYQHIGLDWLVTMYEKRLNGILADEMGLGKTIMTIALLAHLACEKGIWGPHLIVVPTSVMLNWETEFLKWCPAFKILTYFGSAKERKHKRQGWMKPHSFHVCITTYRLVIQDSKIFKRKKWKYLILDEAHLIKNWKSQRWQTLLNFNTKRRILLTGTPLQNDLMELWSLMHFLMPHIFQSHQEFKDWFSNPITGMVEGQGKVNKEVVDRLHNVLRPFLLRRLKRDVEKQLPSKTEHVIYCRLSRRQRNLYEDFIASSETQATLASSSFFGMISVIMQLRKVCNHPDLFEGRPIISSYDMNGIEIQFCSDICSVLNKGPFSTVDLTGLGFVFTHLDFDMASWESDDVQAIQTPSRLIEARVEETENEIGFRRKSKGFNIFEEIQMALREERLKEMKERAKSVAWWNSLRCKRKPIYSTGLREIVSFQSRNQNLVSSKLSEIILSPVDRFNQMVDHVESFMFAIPAARAPTPIGWCSRSGTSVFIDPAYKAKCSTLISPLLTPIRPAIVRRQVYFPDRRLIQFDCGKLQELAGLLRRLKSGGHRALIFTQMTKMLDVLEAFINIYGYTYMRLDGSTQPEERQTLMQRFNTNPKYFLFILSTRSGGVGINLVGADTVIFYDSDWNPAMDQQAQDRCHRIGQTREVHIYRLISEHTIEENILKKAKQKRALDDLVIQSGEYNTEFFKKLDPMELFAGHAPAESNPQTVNLSDPHEEKAMDIVRVEDDDVDMIDDVKRMAAAAAASGKEISSFESQLRPIDRYAVRFLELWDPIVDNAVIETQDHFEETEWELDHIEKLKEDMEADVDDDDEPLVYESWDTEFATKVYQEQVKELAERQLIEDREMEAREKELAELAEAEALRIASIVKKPKSKKKAKKTKFKSLKKEAFSSHTKNTKVESPIEVDDNFDFDDDSDDEVILMKKRKRPVYDTEVKISKKPKKFKKYPEPSPLEPDSSSLPDDEPKDLKLTEISNLEIDHRPISRSKTGLKIFINSMPLKRVMTIRLEKQKKGNIWFNGCIQSPDSWLSSEDAVLCATVHEYGVNWSLVSDVLSGMTAGGVYRGIVRHPVHCCERYRELVQRYEHAKMLLDVVSEQPDQAYTLQKHFFHLLTSVWRSNTRNASRKNPFSTGRPHITGVNHTSRDPIRPQSQNMNFTNIGPMSRLVADALNNSQIVPTEERVCSFSQRRDSRGVGQLGVTLEFPSRSDDDPSVPLPDIVSVLINDSESMPPEHVQVTGNHCFRSSKDIVEYRFRDASRVTAIEDGVASSSSTTPISEVKSRPPTKSQLSGKHRPSNPEAPSKFSKSKSRKAVMEPNEVLSLLRNPNLQPPPMLLPSDLSLRFDMEASVPDIAMDDFLRSEFPIVDHVYDPGFTTGLEDCSLSMDFTDFR
nr:protein photoperiod-independent early flowering 1 isoform X1 [Tanacetum cinerariifolium]